MYAQQVEALLTLMFGFYRRIIKKPKVDEFYQTTMNGIMYHYAIIIMSSILVNSFAFFNPRNTNLTDDSLLRLWDQGIYYMINPLKVSSVLAN